MGTTIPSNLYNLMKRDAKKRSGIVSPHDVRSRRSSVAVRRDDDDDGGIGLVVGADGVGVGIGLGGGLGMSFGGDIGIML